MTRDGPDIWLLADIKIRDEDPTFFSIDPDPAQLEKDPIHILGR